MSKNRLKEFQQASADIIVEKLEATPSRFLLADEVGLGKTEVAKEVIAQLHRKWKKQNKHPRKPFVVLYVCSNLGLIEQNVKRLMPRGMIDDSTDELSHVRRMTLLPLAWGDLWKQQGKIVIIPITPGTFFVRSNRNGRKEERALLYRLLGKKVHRKWWRRVSPGSFRDALQSVDDSLDPSTRRSLKSIRSGLKNYLRVKRLDTIPGTTKPKGGMLLSRAVNLKKENHKGEIMGLLRSRLAELCLDALDPQLVILDEFQRFKKEIIVSDANKSNEIKSIAHERAGNDASLRIDLLQSHRLLLLSATPYSPFDPEGDGTHYRDFYDLVQFLNGHHGDIESVARRKKVEQSVDEYSNALDTLRQALKRSRTDNKDNQAIWERKKRLEAKLREFMLRTERTFYQDSSNIIGLNESKQSDFQDHSSKDKADLSEDHVSSFGALYSLLNGVADRSTMLDWWRSGSHWLSVMESSQYKTIKAAWMKNKSSLDDQQISKHLLYSEQQVLNNEIPETNSRMTELREKLLLGDLVPLWLPPTLQYWGKRPHSSLRSKLLVFSSWRFVPRQLSLVLSSAALGRLKVPRSEKKSRPKDLDFSKGKKTLAPLEALYPSYWLANNIDPIRVARDLVKEGQFESMEHITHPALVERAINILRKELPNAEIVADNESSQKTWELLLFLDKDFLCTDEFRNDPKGHPEGLLEAIDRVSKLKRLRIKEKQLQELASIALGSPSVLLLRSLIRLSVMHGAGVSFHSNKTTKKLQRAIGEDLALIFKRARQGFPPLFTKPYAIAAIRKQTGRFNRKRIFQYCLENHFQEVLDEYLYLLKGQLDDTQNRLDDLTQLLVKALSLHQGRISVKVHERKKNLPCITNFARSFNDFDTEDQGSSSPAMSRDQLREAFNSPFWPMCLVTTAVGQEGLDFHRFCSSIVHWNLSSDPVSFEQREGRIQRFNSLLVRQGIATDEIVNQDLLNRDGNLWENLFHVVEGNWSNLNRFAHGLYPHWVFGSKPIERWILPLPFGAHEIKYRKLNRAVALYRLILGQRGQRSRLQDLEKDLEPNDIMMLSNFALRLSPFDAKGARKSAERHAAQIIGDENGKSIQGFITLVEETIRRDNLNGNSHLEKMKNEINEMIAIVKDHKAHPKKVVIGSIAALYYLCDPYDAIPDVTPGIGRIDDIEYLKDKYQSLR